MRTLVAALLLTAGPALGQAPAGSGAGTPIAPQTAQPAPPSNAPAPATPTAIPEQVSRGVVGSGPAGPAPGDAGVRAGRPESGR